MKNLLLVVVVAFTGLLAGCSSGSSTPTLTSIAITPATASVAAGLTQQLKATGTYSNNTTQDLTATATWSSSNASVATVSGGLAKGVTANATAVTITATVSGVSGDAALTVTVAVLESIVVTPANDSVPVGTLTQFTATGTYSDGSTQNLTATATWTSSNTAVTTISASGLVTALTINATPIMITATSGTVSGNTGLTVAAATLTSIVIPSGPQNTITIANGTSYQFTAWGFYNDGSKRYITSQVTWSSSMPGVATIAPDGHAQSVSNGSTTITATLGSVTENVTLDVSTATVTAIVVGPSGATIAPLTAQPFTAIGTFSDGSTQNITQDVVWASSSTAAATISNTSGSIGVATAVAFGSPTISAAFGGMSGSAMLNVSSATPTSITVTSASAGMAAGSTVALQAIGTFSDLTTQHIGTVATWSSSAPTVASVNGFGIVTGVSNGPVTITCQLGGVSNTASLTVEGLTAIGISTGNKAGLSVAGGTSIGLVATGTLTDGTSQDLTNSVLWTSSNPAVANMSDASGSFGSAIGNAPGTSTVTAVFSGQIGVASLTVTNATLSSITIKPANPTITLGNRLQFGATGTFSDTTTENLIGQVAWTSSDITVAIIDNSGAISTTGTGTTTITATLEGVSHATVLTVN